MPTIRMMWWNTMLLFPDLSRAVFIPLPPVTSVDRMDLTVIRPLMYMVDEADVIVDSGE